MLILQRKKGQSLTIGNEVTITISEISSDSVKLAINAPKDVLILRSELVEAAEENKAAAKTIPLHSSISSITSKRIRLCSLFLNIRFKRPSSF